MASEKALKRLWDAYDVLKRLTIETTHQPTDIDLDTKVLKMVNEMEEFMDDDFSTAKVFGKYV